MDVKMMIDAWPVILTFVMILFWCVRLESKVMYIDKDFETHKEDAADRNRVMWGKLDSLQSTVNQVLQAIGELKGRIDK